MAFKFVEIQRETHAKRSQTEIFAGNERPADARNAYAKDATCKINKHPFGIERFVRFVCLAAAFGLLLFNAAGLFIQRVHTEWFGSRAAPSPAPFGPSASSYAATRQCDL